ncbi:hypothetical protein Y032_0385g421 [Ancylostoma ceylanicum]|uniref:Uncharacterized protein n=1 Tax=Ancylostoma ceylanicum TaxID=53326 RepID=A0A016RSR7_9BILA|nr:hypothetical protein Y032_0385g421 [Ancylostoma ceylanicum]
MTSSDWFHHRDGDIIEPLALSGAELSEQRSGANEANGAHKDERMAFIPARPRAALTWHGNGTAGHAAAVTGVGKYRMPRSESKEFGSFPLIDKSWSYGYHFDITDLLVYFNQNRTIMRELVPYISLDWMDNSVARLTFIPDQSVLKKLLGIGQNDAIDPGKFLKAFGQLALLICEEVGHNCSAGEVSEELKEMYLFVQKISANTTKDSLADEKNYNSIFLHRLSEVDALVSSVYLFDI